MLRRQTDTLQHLTHISTRQTTPLGRFTLTWDWQWWQSPWWGRGPGLWRDRRRTIMTLATQQQHHHHNHHHLRCTCEEGEASEDGQSLALRLRAVRRQAEPDHQGQGAEGRQQPPLLVRAENTDVRLLQHRGTRSSPSVSRYQITQRKHGDCYETDSVTKQNSEPWCWPQLRHMQILRLSGFLT